MKQRKTFKLIFTAFSTMLLTCCILFFTGCKNNDDVVDDSAKKYFAKDNKVVVFEQSGVDKLTGVDIPIGLPIILFRNFISLNNNVYSYGFNNAETNETLFITKLLLSSNKILSDLDLNFNISETDFNFITPNIPILDESVASQKLCLDTLINYKVDASTFISTISPGVKINIDVNLKITLINNGSKTFKLNDTTLNVVSYTTKTEFNATINDPLVQQFMASYNNKLIATGTYENENYFSINYLGIVFQSKALYIKNTLLNIDVVNNLFTCKLISDIILE